MTWRWLFLYIPGPSKVSYMLHVWTHFWAVLNVPRRTWTFRSKSEPAFPHHGERSHYHWASATHVSSYRQTGGNQAYIVRCKSLNASPNLFTYLFVYMRAVCALKASVGEPTRTIVEVCSCPRPTNKKLPGVYFCGIFAYALRVLCARFVCGLEYLGINSLHFLSYKGHRWSILLSLQAGWWDHAWMVGLVSRSKTCI